MINISLQEKLPLPKINQYVEDMKFSQHEIDHLDSALKAAYVKTLDIQDVSAKLELQITLTYYRCCTQKKHQKKHLEKVMK